MSILVGMVIGVVVLILAQFMDGRVACAIGVAAVAGYLIWFCRRARKSVEQLGLTPDELALLQGDLQRGDRNLGLGRIASAQERLRSEFKVATGIDSHTITAMVGRDISWADIVHQVFRVIDFDRADTTIDKSGTVHTSTLLKPYGYLLVESPIMNQRVSLPITHRDDFLLAASVFDEPNLAHLVSEAELLVTYTPKRLLPKGLSGGTSHVLHYVITPPGTLDRYYAIGNDIHMAKPAPEKLFGPFVYKGEIRVHMNPEPIL